jgi:uncharacterized damage-inducible protein DinB
MSNASLRDGLVAVLLGGQAGARPGQVFEAMPAELRTRRPAGHVHSVWELLEHLRLAQEDILRYALDPSWQSPSFPEGYWPQDNPESLSDQKWERALAGFRSDLDQVIALVRNPAIELTARIPHVEPDHTYLREVLLVAEHNAYHLGQVVAARRALGVWPPGQQRTSP